MSLFLCIISVFFRISKARSYSPFFPGSGTLLSGGTFLELKRSNIWLCVIKGKWIEMTYSCMSWHFHLHHMLWAPQDLLNHKNMWNISSWIWKLENWKFLRFFLYPINLGVGYRGSHQCSLGHRLDISL